jgi:hypothetical protein
VLSGPRGLSLDGSGNLFIADTGDNRVQEVTASTGGTQPVAGNGSAGFSADGVAADQSELNKPTGVAVEPAGDLVIADSGNNRVRDVPVSSGTDFGTAVTAGDIYTIYGPGGIFAGDGGPAPAARFNGLNAVAVDAAGDVFVDDSRPLNGSRDNRVLEIPATSGIHFGITMTAGDIYAVAGDGLQGFSGDGGPSTAAQFSSNGIAVDHNGDLFIADSANQVREVAAGPATQFGINMTGGDIYTVAGSGIQGSIGDGGPARSAGFGGVEGVALDGTGDLFIADGSGRIREVPATSGTDFGMAMSAGDIYTVAGDGTPGFSGDGGPAVSAGIGAAVGVSADSAGDVFIDDGGTRVREVPATSGTYFGTAMTSGHIYTVAGNGTQGFSGDGGPGASAQLNDPLATADANGDLLLADVESDQVQEVAATAGAHFGIAMSAGDIYNVAGNGVIGFSGDGGPALSAELSNPGDVAVDTGGDIFVADRGNYRVREVAADSVAPIPPPKPKPPPAPAANPPPKPAPAPTAGPKPSPVPSAAPAPHAVPAAAPPPPVPSPALPAANPGPAPAVNPLPAPVAGPLRAPAAAGEEVARLAEDYSMVRSSRGGLPGPAIPLGIGFALLLAATVAVTWKYRRDGACPAWAGYPSSRQKEVGRWRHR